MQSRTQTSPSPRRAERAPGGARNALQGAWAAIRRHKLGPWIAVAFLALVAWLLADHVRSIEWAEVGAAVRAYPLTTLAAAAGLVVASHVTYACYDLLGRRYVGHRVPVPPVLTTAFISYAFNLSLGPLIGGIGLRARLYHKLGLDAAQIGRIIAFSLVTNWSGWLLLAGTSFALRGVHLPPDFPVGAGLLQVIGVAMACVAVAYVVTCFVARRRSWRWRRHAFELPPGGLALMQLGLSSLNWALMGAIVWVLLPPPFGYFTALATLLGAAIVGAATHVPGGLGVIEAVFVAALGGQVGGPPLIAALLAYRALYYLAPLVVAVVLNVVLEARTRRHARSNA